MRLLLARPCLIVAAAILIVAPYSSGQVTAPTETTKTVSKDLGAIDLAAEIDTVAGRKLRARLVTIDPGGNLAVHNHAGRPTLEYVVQGEVMEIRNGVAIPHKEGDVVVATHDVTHAWENRGSVPAVLLPVDVFLQP